MATSTRPRVYDELLSGSVERLGEAVDCSTFNDEGYSDDDDFEVSERQIISPPHKIMNSNKSKVKKRFEKCQNPLVPQRCQKREKTRMEGTKLSDKNNINKRASFTRRSTYDEHHPPVLAVTRELKLALRQLRHEQKQNLRLREKIKSGQHLEYANVVAEQKMIMKEQLTEIKTIKEVSRRQMLEISELEKNQEGCPEKIQKQAKIIRDLREQLNGLSVRHREDQRIVRMQHDKLCWLDKQNTKLNQLSKSKLGFHANTDALANANITDTKLPKKMKEMKPTKLEIHESKLELKIKDLTMSWSNEQKRSRKAEKKSAAITLQLHEEANNLRQMLSEKQKTIAQLNRRLESFRRRQAEDDVNHSSSSSPSSSSCLQKQSSPTLDELMANALEDGSLNAHEYIAIQRRADQASNHELMALVEEINSSVLPKCGERKNEGQNDKFDSCSKRIELIHDSDDDTEKMQNKRFFPMSVNDEIINQESISVATKNSEVNKNNVNADEERKSFSVVEDGGLIDDEDRVCVRKSNEETAKINGKMCDMFLQEHYDSFCKKEIENASKNNGEIRDRDCDTNSNAAVDDADFFSDNSTSSFEKVEELHDDDDDDDVRI